MTAKETFLLTDISADDQDQRCGMFYWWRRFERGRGILPKEEAAQLAIEDAIKDDLRMIAEMTDLKEEAVDSVVEDFFNGLSQADRKNKSFMELSYMRLGLFAAYALFMEPENRRLYSEVDTTNGGKKIHVPLVLEDHGLFVITKVDRFMMERTTGDCCYVEYVATTQANKGWMDSWKYHPRAHVGLKAATEHLGRTVKFAKIVGFNMGYRSPISDSLSHPYVYGYYNTISKSWSHSYSDTVATEGWERRPVWEYDGGLVEWVRACGYETARHQFPTSQRIYFMEDLFKAWVVRRRVRDVALVPTVETSQKNPEIRKMYFRQNTSQCNPTSGEGPCPYLDGCWNHSSLKDYVPNKIEAQLV